MSIPSLFHRGMLTSEPPSCSQSVDVAFCRALMLRKRPYNPARLVLRPQTPAAGVGFLNPENSSPDSQDSPLVLCRARVVIVKGSLRS